MTHPNIDVDGVLTVDLCDLLDLMPDEALVRAALLLANRTPVLLHVAELLADGVTFDEKGRFYFPAHDDMHEARLYLLKHFEEVQRLTVERAIERREEAEEVAAMWESTARVLAGALERDADAYHRHFARLEEARQTAATYEAEHGRRIR